MYKGILNHYRNQMPIAESTPIVTLSEGNTPLIRAFHLEEKLPGITVYLKYDGLNPTGSFKDRGMTLAVTKALEAGSGAIMCASTGNTAASAAAYAARAGMRCFVVIPNNKIATGKLAQAVVYGAHVLPIEGNFDTALERVKGLCDALPITLVNSINPHRIEGQKSAAFEVCDQLGDAPSHVFLPVGNAGNITAYWKGFQEYHTLGRCTRLPRLCGYQAAGAAPIVDGGTVAYPETIATAIRIGNPASRQGAEAARDESGGWIDKIEDDDIVSAYRALAQAEGIFVEPASAISIAGLFKSFKEGKLEPGSTVVCVLTGNGLKDPDVALSGHPTFESVPDTFEALYKHVEEVLHDH